MASNFAPEIKSSMAKKQMPPPKKATGAAKPDGPGDTPAEMARDKARGIVEGSPQDEALDIRNAPPPRPGGGTTNPAHAAMAASIAHAILQRGG
jgi:hypothetical protein